ncbi:hypothetical protein [Pararhodobacter sp. CCB-MM2]|uniref:hypothetical protein n=1 Tax=Pararhodobacter sp. CCB-MM2 TaxID=1786003 RepID=UPI000834F08F|nr:hypothetical protein [Pararhodobacter sp. CCB-MM2]
MNRFAIGGLSVLGLVVSATTVFADPPAHAQANGHRRGGDVCHNDRDCRVNPGHGVNDERHGGRHAQWGGDDRHARYEGGDTYINIHVGSDGSRGERWSYRDGYGIRRAPVGQEYRVIDGQLVLVNTQTLEVVAIVGLLSALLN